MGSAVRCCMEGEGGSCENPALRGVSSSSFAKMVFLSPAQLVFILIFSCAVVSSTNTTNNASRQDFGILVIGGFPSSSVSQSVEFWSAADPEQGSCVLTDYPREMTFGPTVNLVSGHLVACYGNTCEINREGSWQHLQDTIVAREWHSSAATEEAVLLIGGYSKTTEWIPVDGSAAHQGTFNVRHGRGHCTIQISGFTIVMTGGLNTENYVTQYHLFGGSETQLTPMSGQGRSYHACGVYQDTSGQQVLLITGGVYFGDGTHQFSSTEVATYTEGSSKLEWREVGNLPSGRNGLRAALVDNVIHVTGGRDYDSGDNDLTSILAWDSSSESWQHVGDLATARNIHAAVGLPSSMIEC